jgi:hypothetical protein
MRFLFVCPLLAMLATPGCFHRKAAAPQENFSDFPGLPATPIPAPVEAKPKSKPQSKPAKVQAVAAPAEPKPSSEKLIVTPETGLVGKVETVNQNARYVVLSFPIGHLPAMEQRLHVYRNGLKVGEVKVSGPQIEDNVVADIVEGDSGPGDEVRDK